MPRIIDEEWYLLDEDISPVAIVFLQTRVSSCEVLDFIAVIGPSIRWIMVHFWIKDDFVT